jgi:hypothetical protein
MRNRRRWTVRGVLVLVIFGALIVGSRIEHTTPRLLPMLLFACAVVGVIGLVRDTLGFAPADWTVSSPASGATYAQDGGLFSNVRMLENHLSARLPDGVLQGKLRRLTLGRLAELGLARDDPEVARRLGPTLTDAIEGPPRMLSRAEIDECVRRIEELGT